MGFSLEASAAKPLLVRYPGGEGQRRYFQDAAIRASFIGPRRAVGCDVRRIGMVRIKDGRATEVCHESNDAVVLMDLGAQMPATK